ncbi:unnamed protein product, partial [Ectocarpus sp. 8 AP-2014]
MSLSPSSIRAVLKSAGQRAGGVSELERPARPEEIESAVATADGGEGRISVGLPAGSSHENRSPATRGRSRTPRRGLSVGRDLMPNFLREEPKPELHGRSSGSVGGHRQGQRYGC